MENFPNEYNLTSKTFAKKNQSQKIKQKTQLSIKLACDQISKWK